LPGLEGRPFYRHIVFAPGIDTGYAGVTFPGLVEAIEQGNVTELWKWTGICTGMIKNARKWIEAET
jgi:N-acetylated-alpha-linked acidic dipeptidase